MELRFAVKSETQCAYCVCYLYLSTLTKFDLYRLGLECCNNEVMKVVSKFNFVRKKSIELDQSGRYFFPFLSRRLKENKGATVLFKTRSFMVVEFLF